MLFDYISLAGGLVVLIIAGDVLVRGSVGIAQRLGIPNLVIGLTIVAFGTSAPELVISLKAALEAPAVSPSAMWSVPTSPTCFWFWACPR